MKRVHNFNAGPSALPLPALEQARDELLDFEGSGMSIMEHSHRGKEYERVHDEVLSSLRELLAVPDSHDIVLLQGGAHQQFAQIPMNFLRQGQSADYVLTGGWAERAFEEAKNVGTVRVACTTAVDAGGKQVYRRIPKQSELELDPAAAYVHITSNNTLFGTQWQEFPKTAQPLVADMSSDIMSRPLNVADFALIYAGAQKNIGPSGITVVILKKDWMASARTDIPKFFRYSTHAKERSLYHTPPTFSVYLARNVLRWIKGLGGLSAIEKRNTDKANAVYAAIDAHPELYRAPVEKEARSKMNIVFTLPSDDIEKRFLTEAQKRELIGLKGHRSVGGIRVSCYNAVSLESVQALTSFMNDFAK
jgi:phosphoserine aminotransferase